MALPSPEPGLVIRYSYLWKQERDLGLDEGPKDRPCAIIMSVEDTRGNKRVGVCPVTHTQPISPGEGVAIPIQTARRLGLDDEPCWIMVSEINTFSWPGHDIRPDRDDDVTNGFLPPRLYEEVRKRLIANAERGKLGAVGRD